jgi:hypothetical protein
MEFVTADTFELTGGGASITYDVRSGGLHYRGPARPPQRDFVEVFETPEPVDTPIGRLLTATLRILEDGPTSMVTILVPEVNLAPTGTEAPVEATFETVAIFTTRRSSIGGSEVLEGPLHLYTHVSMTGTARRGTLPAPCEFSATLVGEPAAPGVLRVEGVCTFGSTGYQVALVRHGPRGDNPRDLLLDLVATPPGPGVIVAPVFTAYPVSYEEETEAGFDTVTILPDGPTIEVRTVSREVSSPTPSARPVGDVMSVPIEMISQEREGDEALGFDDGVVFHRNGTATSHHAVDRVPHKYYKGSFDPAEFQRLASVLESEGFFELQDRYGEGWRGTITAADRGGISMKVVRVADVSSAPPNLIRIWEAISSLRQKIQWVETSPDPDPEGGGDGI